MPTEPIASAHYEMVKSPHHELVTFQFVPGMRVAVFVGLQFGVEAGYLSPPFLDWHRRFSNSTITNTNPRGSQVICDTWNKYTGEFSNKTTYTPDQATFELGDRESEYYYHHGTVNNIGPAESVSIRYNSENQVLRTLHWLAENEITFDDALAKAVSLMDSVDLNQQEPNSVYEYHHDNLGALVADWKNSSEDMFWFGFPWHIGTYHKGSYGFYWWQLSTGKGGQVNLIKTQYAWDVSRKVCVVNQSATVPSGGPPAAGSFGSSACLTQFITPVNEITIPVPLPTATQSFRNLIFEEGESDAPAICTPG